MERLQRKIPPAWEGFRGGNRGTETENNSKGQQGEKLPAESHTVYKQNRHQLYKELDGDTQEL